MVTCPVLTVSSLVFLILCSFSQVDGDCKVGDVTYHAGDQWKEEFECIGHACLPDGTYNTTTCPPVKKDLPEGWTVKEENPDGFSFPHCCAEAVPPPEPMFDYSLPGCTADNKTFKVGEQHDIPGHCNYNACKGNNEWAIAACGLIGAPVGWEYIPDDPLKPYPECCGHAVPPLKIVPDVLDKLKWSEDLGVSYGDNVKVELGNELTPTQVKNQPSIVYRGNPKAYYLLSMVDPDAPSRQEPKFREFLHWLVGNIPGKDISAGDVIAEYIGSGPPKGTGLHRYIFLLYKQPGKLDFDEPRVNNTSTESRPKFSIKKFSEKYKLGEPIGVNIYQAQYDDYVPELHRQLGFSAK